MDKRIKENINRDFINRLGISYDEFDKLDFDEQQKLISRYHEKHPTKNSKDTLVMIGGGDESIFMRVPKGRKIWTPNGYYIAGETLEENKKRWEQKMEDSGVKVGISGAPSFMKKFIDKLKSGELKIENLPQIENGENLTEDHVEEQGPIKKLTRNKK